MAIAATLSPPPNAAGWHRTDVTVSFVCAGTGLVTCADPVEVTQEGDHDVTGQASNDAGQVASAVVTVRVDKTAPYVAITSPSEGALVDPGPLDVTGSALDTLSEPVVVCGGEVVTPALTSFACTVLVPSGTSVVGVSATDAAGNSRAAAVTVTTTDAITDPPAALQVTPQTVTMVAGETRRFSAMDDLGRVPPNATWSVDTPGIVTIETEPFLTVTAESAGEVSLTAEWLGVNATADITILPAGPPMGTVLWAAPPGAGPVGDIVQGAVMPDGRQYLYVAERAGTVAAPSHRIRAFEVDGRERWAVAGEGAVTQLSGDPLGGVVALISATSGNVLRQYGPSGSGADLGSVASTFGGFAIHPDGPLYHVASTGGGLALVSKDLGLGVGRRVNLPAGGTQTVCTEEIPGGPQTCTTSVEPPEAGVPTVMADGRVVVPVVTADRVIGPGGTSFTPALNLVFLRPDGTTDVQAIPIDSPWDDAAYPFKAVPNGEGGVLVAWDRVTPGISGVYPYDAMLTGVAMDGMPEMTVDLGDTWSGPAGFGSLVLSEENTILATAYVHDLSNWPTVVPRLNTVTLLRPNGYPITSGDYGALDVTSVLAASGGSAFGGFVVSLSDGTIAGSDPAFAEMSLANAQYTTRGTWIGASGGPFVTMVGPERPIVYSAWPSQRGGGQAANAAANPGPFQERDKAAIVVLQYYNPISIEVNSEYGGSVCQQPDGRFTVSVPNRGFPFSDQVTLSPCPSDTTTVGRYHTHGRDGNLGLSGKDEVNAKASPGIFWYVADPCGIIYKYVFYGPGDSSNFYDSIGRTLTTLTCTQ